MDSPTAKMIRERRLARELTQIHAATLIHVRSHTWQQWETGRRTMHPAFWELFCLKTPEPKNLLDF